VRYGFSGGVLLFGRVQHSLCLSSHGFPKYLGVGRQENDDSLSFDHVICESLIISAGNSLGWEESKAKLNLLTQFFWHHVAKNLLKLFFQTLSQE
jgi:hypothetical protein